MRSKFFEAVMSNALSRFYTFGSYRLDAASRVLTRSGIAVTLAPKTFDLLVLMAGSGGRLLTKRELMEALWKDAFVEEANLSFQMASLRKALDEEARAWIETVPKYGYRFKAPVDRSSPQELSEPEVAGVFSTDRAASGTQSPSSHSWLIAAGVAVLFVAASVAGWQLWFSGKGTRTPFHVFRQPATLVAKQLRVFPPMAVRLFSPGMGKLVTTRTSTLSFSARTEL